MTDLYPICVTRNYVTRGDLPTAGCTNIYSILQLAEFFSQAMGSTVNRSIPGFSLLQTYRPAPQHYQYPFQFKRGGGGEEAGE